MISIRGITIAVGHWYAQTLSLCLPKNLRHLTECVVVTSPQDIAVAALVRDLPGTRLHVTDAFTRHGASFNKGLAMEEGLDVLGRHDGWVLIHDADIMLPDAVPWSLARPGFLNGARRRMLERPSLFRDDLRWDTLPISRDGGPIGFFQLFQAEDPCLTGKRPWYDVSFAHAGGGDAYFLNHWPNSRRAVLPFDCLHLGPRDSHWFGLEPDQRDVMRAFIVRNGWTHSHPNIDKTAADRVGPIKDRVEVPGYPPSGFELPFVKRAKTAGTG